MPPTASSAAPGPGPSSAAYLQLDQSVIERLRPARAFKDAIEIRENWTSTAQEEYSARPQISSIAFDDTGELCVTAGEDEAFAVWDASKGTMKKRFYSRKYGISQICFAHKSTNIIHTSTMGDNDIRYHSTHDNKYLLYLKGHTARVRSIQMHPTKDCCISAGDDGTVRLWDLRNPKCQALLNNVGGSTVAAYDHDGTVFVVASSDIGAVMLYGTDSPDAAPFHYIQLVDHELGRISQPPRQPIFTSISFSPKGDQILVGTSSDVHYVLDGYNLHLHRRLVGHQGLEVDYQGKTELQPRRGGSGAEVGWTADSRWVYSGSSDGHVCFWDMAAHPTVPLDESGTVPPVQTLPPTVRLKPENLPGAGPARAVRFNPRYGMMAVGGEQLSFWLPEREDKLEEGF